MSGNAIPAKTVERLVAYRVILESAPPEQTHIFSNQIAQAMGNTAAQVRRDLMAIGYSGNTRQGYCIADLLDAIRQLLSPAAGVTFAIAGIGNLGRALLGFFSLLQPQFRIMGAYDTDPHKVGRIICGHRILHIRDLAADLAAQPVQMGVVTVSPDQAQRVADLMVAVRIKGIISFAPVPVTVPAGVWLENMHITAIFEKVAYFARMNQQGGQA
jgi:redox-sensing transcriptional repressor